jgi:CheY-like chemotaxis protein
MAAVRDPALGVRVLLAEDNPINRDVAMAMLEDLGCQVEVVETGRAACDAVTRTAFDLVLMDCQMPEVDGFEATRELRRREHAGGTRRVPIVALTANALPGDRERCLEAGMDDFIRKPFRREDLRVAILRHCRPGAVPEDTAGAEAVDPPLVATALDRIRAVQRPGRPDVLRRVLEMYRDSTPAQLDALERGAAGGDLMAVRETAHALKGTSVTIGAAALADRLAAIEALARQGAADALGAAMAEVRRQHGRVLRAVAAELGRIAPEARSA